MVGMLQQIAITSRTPSVSAASHEAISAVQSALESLPADYREALRLRHIEGLAVAEVAAQMGRTEAAVQMLCHRALRQLATVMGSASRFLSR